MARRYDPANDKNLNDMIMMIVAMRAEREREERAREAARMGLVIDLPRRRAI